MPEANTGIVARLWRQKPTSKADQSQLVGVAYVITLPEFVYYFIFLQKDHGLFYVQHIITDILCQTLTDLMIIVFGKSRSQKYSVTSLIDPTVQNCKGNEPNTRQGKWVLMRAH